jgi:hypothetical protein
VCRELFLKMYLWEGQFRFQIKTSSWDPLFIDTTEREQVPGWVSGSGENRMNNASFTFRVIHSLMRKTTI